MRKIAFHLIMRMMPMLLSLIAMTNVYAIQPWEDGVKPLLNRLAEIDQALSLNLMEAASEHLTAPEFIHLAAERDSLLIEKAHLIGMCAMSVKVRDSRLVIYALPPDARFNSAPHADAQARK